MILQLKKGNIDDLAGNVILYVENIGSLEEGTCQFPSREIKVKVIEKEVMGELLAAQESSQKEKRLVREEAVSSLLVDQSDICSDDEPGDFFEGDVVYGGRIFGHDVSRAVLSQIMGVYAHNFYSQYLLKNSGEQQTDNYKEYLGDAEGLKTKLSCLVGILLTEAAVGNKKGMVQSSVSLRRFVRGSKFEAHIDDLVDYINRFPSGMENPDEGRRVISYSDLCAGLMYSVEKEEFEVAQKRRSQLTPIRERFRTALSKQ